MMGKVKERKGKCGRVEKGKVRKGREGEVSCKKCLLT
jgi:hypothetical protein